LSIADWLYEHGRGYSPNAMNADDLKKRTKQFALRILKLVAALPNTVGGRAIGGQLVRSGTSVGSNYRAACRGRSRAEFVAKLGVVEEEADESAFWMEMIIEGELLNSKQVEPLLNEANELTKIMAQSRISAATGLSRTTKRPATSKVVSNRQSAIGNRQ
jgi:four helix bundle protein